MIRLSSFSSPPINSSSCISTSLPSLPNSYICLCISSTIFITISALWIATITFFNVTISLNSYSFNIFNLLSNTFLYFSNVCIAWFALFNTTSVSSNIYLSLPLNTVIILLLCEILITNSPVCFAVLSAVLCLVPVSNVVISREGINCAFAYNIFFRSPLKIIAPSIFASSYNLEDVYSSLIVKPPSTICFIISLLSVINNKAPVLALNMFSNPSLIGVPGAINFRISVILSSLSFLKTAILPSYYFKPTFFIASPIFLTPIISNL